MEVSPNCRKNRIFTSRTFTEWKFLSAVLLALLILTNRIPPRYFTAAEKEKIMSRGERGAECLPFSNHIIKKDKTIQTIIDDMGASNCGANYDELFMTAAGNGDVLKLQKFLQQGANVNAKDKKFGLTALHRAYRNGNLTTSKLSS